MIQAIATCVTAAGVLIAVLGLRASQQQRLREFEAFYVQRYWGLMDGLSLPALRGESGGRVCPDDERVVWSYLRLCEDQLELRKAGWISDATWAAWLDGMRQQVRRWPFEPIWHLAAQGPDFNLLKHTVVGGEDDPCKLGWWRRRIVGLGGSMPI